MKIPNTQSALIELNKLTDYALSRASGLGSHKARKFEQELSVTAKEATMLQDWLLEAVIQEDATLRELNEYGQRYRVDFTIPGVHGDVTIRSGWIIRTSEDFPRLTTCYVIKVVKYDKPN